LSEALLIVAQAAGLAAVLLIIFVKLSGSLLLNGLLSE
jgi:hypothetical protein